MAQVDCYACMYGQLHDLETVKVRITYIHLETEAIKTFEFERRREELEIWFKDLVLRYAKWARGQIDWQEQRDETIHHLSFPGQPEADDERGVPGD